VVSDGLRALRRWQGHRRLAAGRLAGSGRRDSDEPALVRLQALGKVIWQYASSPGSLR
jgi:hypothetical protein